MKPKFVAGEYKKQSPQEPVYDFFGDVQTVIGQIVSDLKEKDNTELRKRMAVNWKELQWYNAKMTGTKLQISIEKTEGGLRTPKYSQLELQKLLKETMSSLRKFETALREEFRKRTGKALTWIDPKEFADYQLVAMNGLYLFVAKKVGEVKTILPGQKFEKE
jgi:hypothetical protein